MAEAPQTFTITVPRIATAEMREAASDRFAAKLDELLEQELAAGTPLEEFKWRTVDVTTEIFVRGALKYRVELVTSDS